MSEVLVFRTNYRRCVRPPNGSNKLKSAGPMTNIARVILQTYPQQVGHTKIRSAFNVETSSSAGG